MRVSPNFIFPGYKASNPIEVRFGVYEKKIFEAAREMRDLIEVLIRQKTSSVQSQLLRRITSIYAGGRVMCAPGARGGEQSSGIPPLYGSVSSQQLHLWRGARGAN